MTKTHAPRRAGASPRRSRPARGRDRRSARRLERAHGAARLGRRSPLWPTEPGPARTRAAIIEETGTRSTRCGAARHRRADALRRPRAPHRGRHDRRRRGPVGRGAPCRCHPGGVGPGLVGGGAHISDASDASRVFTNLILNAIAWTPRGARVRVETEADALDALVRSATRGPASRRRALRASSTGDRVHERAAPESG